MNFFAGGRLLYAIDDYRAAEIEETFSLHMAIPASNILNQDVQNVVVFPVKLKQRDVLPVLNHDQPRS